MLAKSSPRSTEVVSQVKQTQRGNESERLDLGVYENLQEMGCDRYTMVIN